MDCLFTDETEGYAGVPLTNDSIFKVKNWDSLVILPKHVAFKGDNRHYLRACMISKESYLQFSGANASDEAVANEIVPIGDGSVRLKSIQSDKFWISNPKNGFWKPSCWIRADADSDTTSSNRLNQVFQPRRVANCANYITLLNLGSNSLCKRLTSNGKKDCLAAANPSNDQEQNSSARMMVEENVTSRKIYNVTYKYQDAKIHREETSRQECQSAHNGKQGTTDTMCLKFIRGEKITSSWKSTVSRKEGQSIRITAAIPIPIPVPLTVGFQWDTHREYNNAYEWGKTEEVSKGVESSYDVPVPENKKVKVYATEKVVWLDVPYSYTEDVTLSDGKVLTYQMDDGVYSSKCSYHYEFKSVIEE
ncbi:hypothetical protein Tsubulata_008110 [Turnera subulata]|uniref:Agglutinin domain-containing protein n=1 Tax=Turnera subulata TaxID=218843 RepID=A0A9Q0JIN6_9ROSI|nr:hypothetical protein Tsubulata_008110 [Turnera subulata]